MSTDEQIIKKYNLRGREAEDVRNGIVTKYYTVRGFKKGKLDFESIGMTKSKAIELREDIKKNGSSWAKGMRFTLKRI